MQRPEIRNKIHKAYDRIENSRAVKFMGKHKYSLYAVYDTAGMTTLDLGLMSLIKDYDAFKSPSAGLLGIPQYLILNTLFEVARTAPIIIYYAKTRNIPGTLRMYGEHRVLAPLEDPLFYFEKILFTGKFVNPFSPFDKEPGWYEFASGNVKVSDYLLNNESLAAAYIATTEVGIRIEKKFKLKEKVKDILPEKASKFISYISK
jgi:hypothetical protein